MKNKIKWIIGYIDSYGKMHHKVIGVSDTLITHTDIWPNKLAAHGKWRWRPEKEFEIDTYGEDIDDDDLYAIYDTIEHAVRNY